MDGFRNFVSVLTSVERTDTISMMKKAGQEIGEFGKSNSHLVRKKFIRVVANAIGKNEDDKETSKMVEDIVMLLTLAKNRERIIEELNETDAIGMKMLGKKRAEEVKDCCENMLVQYLYEEDKSTIAATHALAGFASHVVFYNAIAGILTLNLKSTAELINYFKNTAVMENIFMCQSLIQMAGIAISSDIGQNCETWETFWTQVVTKSNSKRAKAGWKAEFDKSIFNQRATDAYPWFGNGGLLKDTAGAEWIATDIKSHMIYIDSMAKANGFWEQSVASASAAAASPAAASGSVPVVDPTSASAPA